MFPISFNNQSLNYPKFENQIEESKRKETSHLRETGIFKRKMTHGVL